MMMTKAYKHVIPHAMVCCLILASIVSCDVSAGERRTTSVLQRVDAQLCKPKILGTITAASVALTMHAAIAQPRYKRWEYTGASMGITVACYGIWKYYKQRAMEQSQRDIQPGRLVPGQGPEGLETRGNVDEPSETTITQPVIHDPSSPNTKLVKQHVQYNGVTYRLCNSYDDTMMVMINAEGKEVSAHVRNIRELYQRVGWLDDPSFAARGFSCTYGDFRSDFRKTDVIADIWMPSDNGQWTLYREELLESDQKKQSDKEDVIDYTVAYDASKSTAILYWMVRRVIDGNVTCWIKCKVLTHSSTQCSSEFILEKFPDLRMLGPSWRGLFCIYLGADVLLVPDKITDGYSTIWRVRYRNEKFQKPEQCNEPWQDIEVKKSVSLRENTCNVVEFDRLENGSVVIEYLDDVGKRRKKQMICAAKETT